MKILIVGGAGFLGTNLALELLKDEKNTITLMDTKIEYFTVPELKKSSNVFFKQLDVREDDLDCFLREQDYVFHLVSTTNPTSSNNNIEAELHDNISFSIRLLESCVKQYVKKVIFISSGGTVYGNVQCPISERAETNPISAYGIQKLTIEKIFALYHYLYGINYNIIRLANPYGPYQRPNGKLGALTTFTYKAIHNESIEVYGDGSVIRDYIYIEDAIRAILNVCFGNPKHHIYNIGSGIGISISEIIRLLQDILKIPIFVNYEEARNVDLKQNYLDISRYENEFGSLVRTSITEGIEKTAQFLYTYSVN